MISFVYKGKDKKANDVSGSIEAADVKQALNLLREHGMTIISLSEKKEINISVLTEKFQKVSEGDLVGFTRQLSTMITAGLPLTDALTILQGQSRPAMANLIGGIIRDIEGGANLATALEKKSGVFSRIYVALVRAGESAGVLDKVLARLADNLEKQRDFRSKTKGALVYPAIVILAMVVVTFIMMIFVIPKLTSLYKDMNVTLPAPTLLLISISNFMVQYWWLIIIAVILGGFFFQSWRKTPIGMRMYDGFMLKLPIFGPLKKEITLAEFCRTFGLLSGAGIPIIEALNIVSEAMDNLILREGVVYASKQVEKGFPLATAISENDYYPQILSQMIRVGEETGKIDEVLTKLSAYFESESEQLVKGLTTALEPLIMVLLGLGVAFLVLAIIMPIYQLTSTF